MNHKAKCLTFGIIAVLFISASSIFLIKTAFERDVPIPRQKAYLRIDPYASEYVDYEILPITLSVNSSACVNEVTDSATAKGGKWLNISYPRYHATVYCSYLPVTKRNLATELENRHTRIMLNSRVDNPRCVIFEDSLKRYSAEVFFAPVNNATPLQFIVTDSTNFIFTGALFTNDATHDPDSINPIVEYITDDIMVMLQNIKLKR